MNCVENSDQILKDEEPFEAMQEEIQMDDEKHKCYTCDTDFSLFELEIHFTTCDGPKESSEINQTEGENNLNDHVSIEENINDIKVVEGSTFEKHEKYEIVETDSGTKYQCKACKIGLGID